MFTRIFTKSYFSITLVSVISLLVLSACGLVPHKPSSPPEPASPIPKPIPPKPSYSESLLVTAENLYKRGRLIAPEEDNAYIRYKAVEILEPENQQAKAGLAGILIHEVALTKDLLAKSKVRAAEKKLVVLERLFPAADSLVALRKDVDTAKAKVRTVKIQQSLVEKRTSERPGSENRILLDAQRVSSRDANLILELESIAKKVSETKQGVLIYARSDSDARWIYQQMRKATPEYRIRGDIRIGRPAIELLSPFDE